LIASDGFLCAVLNAKYLLEEYTESPTKDEEDGKGIAE
jgi:hypothetical protein